MRAANSEIPESYKALFPFLLRQELWSLPSNVPGLVRLFQAYLRVSGTFVGENYLNTLLEIFQKLIASKNSDQHGFKLLNSIICYVPYVSRFSHTNMYSILFHRAIEGAYYRTNCKATWPQSFRSCSDD